MSEPARSTDVASDAEFAVGDFVNKVGGRYGGPGEVVGRADGFEDGRVLFNVAHKIEGGYGRFVHVYPATALERSARIRAPITEAVAGWKLVPIEPTDEMLVAAEEAVPALSSFAAKDQSPSYIAWRTMLAAAPAHPLPQGEAGPGATCTRCQGNGEIVTDWDRYLHAQKGDVGDEAVAECPDCDGSGTLGEAVDTDELVERLTKVADEFSDKSRDLRNDDATRRGYIFASELVKREVIKPVQESLTSLGAERDELKSWQRDQVVLIDDTKALITELHADVKVAESSLAAEKQLHEQTEQLRHEENRRACNEMDLRLAAEHRVVDLTARLVRSDQDFADQTAACAKWIVKCKTAETALSKFERGAGGLRPSRSRHLKRRAIRGQAEL